MSRGLFIAGNWKMHKTLPEAREAASAIASGLGPLPAGVQVGLFPNFVCLAAVAEAVADSGIVVGAQDLFWQPRGAYTGEVSAGMILSAGASAVLIGHSERRQYFGESERTLRKKMAAALEAGLKPVLCVGELLEERESGQTEGVLASQLAGALAGFDPGQLKTLTIAYEPVWAIGTGKSATAQMAQQAHSFIRSWLEQAYGPELATSVRILYGGSVKPANAAELMSQPDIDGVLVGGASLEPESFLGIISAGVAVAGGG